MTSKAEMICVCVCEPEAHPKAENYFEVDISEELIRVTARIPFLIGC